MKLNGYDAKISDSWDKEDGTKEIYVQVPKELVKACFDKYGFDTTDPQGNVNNDYVQGEVQFSIADGEIHEVMVFPVYYNKEEEMYECGQNFVTALDDDFWSKETLRGLTVENHDNKNIDLGTFTVDVQLQLDGTFDVYIAHEGSSGEHYKDINADKIGEFVAGDIECIAEEYKEEFDIGEEK